MPSDGGGVDFGKWSVYFGLIERYLGRPKRPSRPGGSTVPSVHKGSRRVRNGRANQKTDGDKWQ